MKSELVTAALKSGESLRVSCVLGPEPSEALRIAPLLGHKGGVWNWHTEKALSETLGTLENRFYIGEIDGEIAGNICTFEQGGVGILGHVFTRDEQRRKGIATILMQALMDDFRQRGGTSLFLGTGYDSPAYHIYHSFGFRSVLPGSGDMRYDALPPEPPSPDSDVIVREAEWGDWARLNLLLMRTGEPYLRNQAQGWFGPSNVEGGFLTLMESRFRGRAHRAWIMETTTRNPVGFATLIPARPWPQPLHQLDLHIHPDFATQASHFLSNLPLPAGKIQAYTESPSPELSEAFIASGWQQEGVLRNHLTVAGVTRDVLVWGRM